MSTDPDDDILENLVPPLDPYRIRFPHKSPGYPGDLLGDEFPEDSSGGLLELRFGEETPRRRIPYPEPKMRGTGPLAPGIGPMVYRPRNAEEMAELKAGIDNIDLLKPPPQPVSTQYPYTRDAMGLAMIPGKDGQHWEPAIPLPIYGIFFTKVCGKCHRRFCTRDGYRGHWLLIHHHKLGLD